MGSVNCCKKPEEILIDEIKNNGEGDKINALDQDSYPQDTEYVLKANMNPEEENVSNQKLYQQEGSPRIDGAYEVAINESSPVQYKQVEVSKQNEIHTPVYENENESEQVEKEPQNLNQYSPEALAAYQNQNQIQTNSNAYEEEIDQNNQPDDTPNKRNVEEINNIKQNQEIVQPNISNISNTGAVDLTVLTSQKSAAPINTLSQVVQTPLTNNKAINIQQNMIQPEQEINNKIQVKEPEEGEDLNKYFQIPTSLSKSKTTLPSNIGTNDVQKLIQQNQVNVASVTPLEGNDDINQYFTQISTSQQNQNLSDKELLNKYFTHAVSEEINPQNITQSLNLQNIANMKQPQTTTTTTVIKTNENLPINDINNNYKQVTTTTTTKTTGNVDLRNIPSALTNSEIKRIVDMKDLPTTFGSNDINNFQQKTTTTTTTTKTTGNVDLSNIPSALTNSEIKKIVDMKDLPNTFGSNDINNFQQKTTTTTTTTKTTGNADLRNIPSALTNSEIKRIVDMKDLPTTFGSNDINNFQQKATTTTTTTKTTGNVDLSNIPSALTNSQIKKIVDMKDLPTTFGSNDINNFQQKTTTTTTTTKTTGNADLRNIPSTLTNSEIKRIVDMKDLPTTFGSNDIKNFNQKTTTTTTTTQTTGNIPKALTPEEIQKIINMKDLPETIGSSTMTNVKKTTVTTTNVPGNNLNNSKPITTTTKTEITGSIPKALTQEEIQKIINMKDLPETIGSSTMTNVKKTTYTNTSSSPVNIDLKQFGLEQNPSMSPIASEPLDLKHFGLEPTTSAVSNIGKKQITTVTKTVQNSGVPLTEDYSKYFQNIQTTSSNNPIDLKQFGLENNASDISNLLQGSNITFKQPGQSLVSSNNNTQNKNIVSASSTPIITNDYNQYFKTANTMTTSGNQKGVTNSTTVNPAYNYTINTPYTKATTITTTNKTTGIPVSSATSYVTKNYTLPTNYTTNKVTSTKVTKSTYGVPIQTTGYSYSYNIPTTTTTTTTIKK